jgi:enoyl-CoA hydratase/carnithine racemase
MIEVEQSGKTLILRLAHGKANALDTEFCKAIVSRFEEARDSAAAAVILTGQGQIFSAGVDLLRVLDGGATYLNNFLPALINLFETVFFYPKPVVAAINGHAIAGGCVLACAADYRIMANQEIRIGIPELRVGVPFPTIALEIMRFVAAPKHFPSMLYGGATFSPKDAVDEGLVNAIAEPNELIDKAVEMANSLAGLPVDVFSLTKQQLREPALRCIQESGPRLDRQISDLWARPETLEVMRDYVARTLRKSRP